MKVYLKKMKALTLKLLLLMPSLAVADDYIQDYVYDSEFNAGQACEAKLDTIEEPWEGARDDGWLYCEDGDFIYNDPASSTMVRSNYWRIMIWDDEVGREISLNYYYYGHHPGTDPIELEYVGAQRALDTCIYRWTQQGFVDAIPPIATCNLVNESDRQYYRVQQQGNVVQYIPSINLRFYFTADEIELVIEQPTDGMVIEKGQAIPYVANAIQGSDDVSSNIEWYLGSRSLENLVGTGSSGQISTPPAVDGSYLLIAYANVNDQEIEQQVSFTIASKPVLTIDTPFANDSFKSGDVVTFSGVATQGSQVISDSITWTSSIAGLLGTGATLEVDTLASGEHVITAQVVYENISTEYVFSIFIDKVEDDENLGDEQACSGASFGGNPINLQNGNKIQVENDYVSNGKNPLKVIRTYNSLSIETGVFGYGWAANFEKKIVHLLGANPAIEVKRSSGVIERFVKINGEWQGKHINTATLTELVGGGFEYKSRKGWSEVYDEKGLLVSETDVDGYSLYFSYVDEQLSKMTDDAGRALQFSYNADGFVSKIITPDQHEYAYDYDAKTNLARIYYPQDYLNGADRIVFKEYLYENTLYPHALTGIFDETGKRYASWLYDDNGRAYYSEHGNGFEAITIDYSKYGETITTNEFGKQTTFNYGLINGVLKTTSIKGHQSNLCAAKLQGIEYYDNGFIKEKIDWNGHKTAYEYNDRGLTTSTKIFENQNTTMQDFDPTWLEQASYQETTLWMADQPRIDIINKPGLRSDFDYHENGLLASVTQTNLVEVNSQEELSPQEIVATYSYEYHQDSSRVKTMMIDGPRLDVIDNSSIEFDAIGNITKTTDAKGFTESFTYTRANYSATGITDKNGVLSNHVINHRGWLQDTSISHGGRTLQSGFSYYENGLKQAESTPNDSVIDYEYDDAYNLISRKNSVNATENIIPAKNGSLLQKSLIDSSGVSQYQLDRIPDEEGRTHKIIGAEGEESQYEYDANGNVTKEIKKVSANHFITTTYRYDWANRVIEMRPQKGAVIQYHYRNDYLSQVDAISGSEVQSTLYHYDGYGNLLMQSSPVTGSEINKYDESGNLVRKIDAKGVAVDYKYDELNRMTHAYYPTPELNQNYVYDEDVYGIGRLTSVTLGGERTQYSYNYLGQVIQQTYLIEQSEFVINYDYGDDGMLDIMTYPSGRYVRFEYDEAGQTSAVYSKAAGDNNEQMMASDINYLPFGPINSMILGNGLAEEYRYDHSYRMTGNTNWSEYDYNGLSFIIKESGVFAHQGSAQYEYDDANRLSLAKWENVSIAYEYDDFGNRIAREFRSNDDVIGRESNQINSGNNQLLNITHDDLTESGQFKYDLLGNMIEDPRRSLVLNYGDDNRLRSITKDDSQIASYSYNVQGQRTRKRIDNKDLYFHYDANGLLIAESNSDGELLKEYIYLNGRPLAVTTPETHVWNESETDEPTLLAASQTTIEAGSESPVEMNIQHTGDGETSAFFASEYSGVGSTASGLFIRDSSDQSAASVSINIIGEAAIIPIAMEIFIPIPMIINQKIEVVTVDASGYETREYYEQDASWLKLNRREGVVEFYVSTDGSDWQLLSTVLDELPEEVIMGVSALNSTVEVSALEKTYTNTPLFFHNDTTGTPKAMTNSIGVLVWTADFTPFGDKPAIFSEFSGITKQENALRFPGQYADSETGYSYNYFRDYDPSLGRYIQSDPIGLNGGLNTYGYAYQNPVINTDPRGLFVPQVAGGIGGFAFGLWSALAQGQTGWCAIRSGLYGGVAGAVSGGGSLVTAMLVSSAISVAEQSGRNGFENVSYLEAGVNGLTAGFGGSLGGAFARWKYPVRNYYPTRSKWNPKYWGEKVGLNDSLPPIDLNDLDRDVMTGALGAALEHGANTLRPSAGGGSCGCN